ncbi:TniQ family protein [Delftia acidovorans]|uniref:TniQ family protein n=1 Tax=Delftia acidovorans TaxID=80866 RepID=UPI001EFD6BD6|nr:TniQ family protein [Delftia acidovorans]MCG8988814.1 TniQ family protein [Delftia acidovorans]
MKALPLRPAPIAGEPLDSYIERLAHANDCTASELTRLIRQCGDDHLAGLAGLLGGQSLVAFGSPAIPKIGIPVRSFGLPATSFTHRRMRVCPSCVAESPWIRPLWRLKVVTACPLHGITLVQHCRRCHEPVRLNTALTGACGCGLHYRASAHQVGSAERALMRAIDDSLHGAGNLVSGDLALWMNTAEWSKLLRYAGRLIQGPTLEHPGQIAALEDLDVARGIVQGTLALLQDWPDAYWRCLQKFVDAAPWDGSIRRVFTPLYTVIYQRLPEPAFQFLRDGFETFLLEHWRGELCGRHRAFRPETLQNHPRKGLAKLAREAGMGRSLLKRLVHNDYLPGIRFRSLSGQGRETITVNASQVAELLPDRAAYRDLKSTAQLLGLKRSRLRQFVALGILQADCRPDWSRRSHWHFHKAALQDFIARLRMLSTGEALGSCVTLGEVLQFWQLAPQELRALFDALWSGELPLRMTENTVISAMVLDGNRTRSWLEDHRRRTIPWLTPTQASQLLEVKEQVVYELIGKHLLVADLVSGGRSMLKRIQHDSLKAFQRDYVSLSTLAKAAGTTATALLTMLPAKPVTGPRIDGGRQYFFRREDLVGLKLSAAAED